MAKLCAKMAGRAESPHISFSSTVGASASQTSEASTPFQRFSRFNRDACVWIAISDAVLWSLAQRAAGLSGGSGGFGRLGCWSCGCSSGEEAYYLSMVWQRRLAPYYTNISFSVLGTDISEHKLAAARRGRYPLHSVKGLPTDWLHEFFKPPPRHVSAGAGAEPHWLRQGQLIQQRRAHDEAQRRRAASTSASLAQRSVMRTLGQSAGAEEDTDEDTWLLQDHVVKGSVSFLQQDVKNEMPDGPFDLILSRYAICLYLEAEAKETALAGLVDRLRPGGFLVIGEKESLPTGFCERYGLSSFFYCTQRESCPFGPRVPMEGIYQKVNEDQSSYQSAPSKIDPRALASTYTSFLRESSGQEPDWVAERNRVWNELTRRKMSNKSRSMLARAVQEGRREDSGDLLSRMVQDHEVRQERARARESERQSADSPPIRQQTFTRDEAQARIQQFFERLGKDIAHRETVSGSAKQAVVTPGKPSRSKSRKRTRRSKTLTSVANAGLAGTGAEASPARTLAGAPGWAMCRGSAERIIVLATE